MPRQRTYFDYRTDAKRVQVIKTYGAAYARSCFDEMNSSALIFLSKSLDLTGKYVTEEPLGDATWDDVEDEAREDGNCLSFFIVIEELDGRARPVYVAPDWPSAEAYAKLLTS